MYEDTLLEKLEYLLETKGIIMQAIKDIGSATINEDTLFRSYADEIKNIHSEILEVCKLLQFTVEGGDLNEIMTQEDLTIQDTLPYIQSILESKNKLSENLAAKGVPAENTEAFIDLVEKVLMIVSSSGISAEYVAEELDNINGEIIPEQERDLFVKQFSNDGLVFKLGRYRDYNGADMITGMKVVNEGGSAINFIGCGYCFIDNDGREYFVGVFKPSDTLLEPGQEMLTVYNDQSFYDDIVLRLSDISITDFRLCEIKTIQGNTLNNLESEVTLYYDAILDCVFSNKTFINTSGEDLSFNQLCTMYFNDSYEMIGNDIIRNLTIPSSVTSVRYSGKENFGGDVFRGITKYVINYELSMPEQIYLSKVLYEEEGTPILVEVGLLNNFGAMSEAARITMLFDETYFNDGNIFDRAVYFKYVEGANMHGMMSREEYTSIWTGGIILYGVDAAAVESIHGFTRYERNYEDIIRFTADINDEIQQSSIYGYLGDYVFEDFRMKFGEDSILDINLPLFYKPDPIRRAFEFNSYISIDQFMSSDITFTCKHKYACTFHKWWQENMTFYSFPIFITKEIMTQVYTYYNAEKDIYYLIKNFQLDLNLDHPLYDEIMSADYAHLYTSGPYSSGFYGRVTDYSTIDFNIIETSGGDYFPNNQNSDVSYEANTVQFLKASTSATDNYGNTVEPYNILHYHKESDIIERFKNGYFDCIYSEAICRNDISKNNVVYLDVNYKTDYQDSVREISYVKEKYHGVTIGSNSGSTVYDTILSINEVKRYDCNYYSMRYNDAEYIITFEDDEKLSLKKLGGSLPKLLDGNYCTSKDVVITTEYDGNTYIIDTSKSSLVWRFYDGGSEGDYMWNDTIYYYINDHNSIFSPNFTPEMFLGGVVSVIEKDEKTSMIVDENMLVSASDLDGMTWEDNGVIFTVRATDTDGYYSVEITNNTSTTKIVKCIMELNKGPEGYTSFRSGTSSYYIEPNTSRTYSLGWYNNEGYQYALRSFCIDED